MILARVRVHQSSSLLLFVRRCEVGVRVCGDAATHAPEEPGRMSVLVCSAQCRHTDFLSRAARPAGESRSTASVGDREFLIICSALVVRSG
jgi:hypothetical protein